MTRVGITGHQELSSAGDWLWVEEMLDDALLAIERPFVGLSALAKGADQMFARLVLKHSGSLEVVLPFRDYRSEFDRSAQLEFDRLWQRASSVQCLRETTPAPDDRDQAYLDAGKYVVNHASLLLAVWENRREGSTAAVVEYARREYEGRKDKRGLIIFDPLKREVYRKLFT